VTVIWTDGRGARRQLVALVLAGAAAGAAAPALTATAGPAAAPGALSLTLAAGGWLGRGRGAPAPAQLILAAVGGVVAGLLGLSLGPALATALLGGVVGLALTPSLHGGLRRVLLRCLPAAAGALALGVVGGALGLAPAFAGLNAGAQSAVLGALLGLGVGLGELTRYAVLTAEQPVWITELQETCGAQSRPLLDAAVDGYSRVVRSVRRAQGMDAFDRQETLVLAGELLESAARALREADEAERATLSLARDAGELEAHPELHQARATIRASLDQQAEEGRAEAGRHAARLTRMAAAFSERPQPGRTEALSRRLETIEQRVIAERVRR
jgi:hypothetical protein